MTKNIVRLLLITLVGFFSAYTSAQSFEKGEIHLDASTGIISSKRLINLAIQRTFEGAEDLKISGWPATTYRVEYGLLDELSVGLGVVYKSTKADFRYGDTIYVENQPIYTIEDADYRVELKRWRIQARVAWHFLRHESWDLYLAGSLGSNTRKFQVFKNGEEEFGRNFTGIFAVSGRFAFGARYYIKDIVGLHVETGIGGPFISGGISLKFNTPTNKYLK